jgi:hypothetical protein
MIILDTAGDTIQATASTASTITITLYGMERTASGTEYKRLGQGQITATGTTTLYTLPADTTAVVSQLIAVNVDTSKRTFDLWHVPNGSSAANTNILLDDMELESKQTWIWGKEG